MIRYQVRIRIIKNMYFLVNIYKIQGSVYQFKSNINEMFPLIYDTKFISTECKKV